MKCPIPDDVMAAAYAAAGDADDEPQQHTPKPATPTSSKQSEHKSSKGGNDAQPLTSTMRSTITKTTTDGSGNTLQLVVPIVVGPSGISTGAISTSTLDGRATSTDTQLSTSPAAASTPNFTLLPSSTSATRSQQTRNPGGGSGSPFDAPAAASRWVVSGPLLVLGVLAICFLRL
jgi:hypothetical protein